MKFSIAKTHLEKMLAQRNGYMMLSLGLVFVCLVQGILIFVLIGREKIIIVPPDIDKSFWVSSRHVSENYLAEMTRFFVMLRLDVTPERAGIQRETILRYTDPDFYGLLNSQLVQEADRMRDQNISMAFFPSTDIRTNEKKLKAIIEGDLKSWVGDMALPSKHVKYLLSYGYHSGRLFLKSFEEVKRD